jgi:hypothetical protein
MFGLKQRSDLTAINFIHAMLAAFLFFSPWLVGFHETLAASWNAWICGAVVGFLAIAAINALYEWEEWANVAFGLWTAVAPWILGFADVPAVLWTHVGVGLAVALLAAIELWILHSNPPTRAV